ncbi:MAG: hypothetical protein SGCHY_001028, partial [Lobulomycetales sp.]
AYGFDPEKLLNSTHVSIIGLGNVAIDCARILLKDPAQLALTSDIPEHALKLLARSRVRHVDIIGRRGPLEASFTAKEVRGLVALPNLAGVYTDARHLLTSALESIPSRDLKHRPRRRLLEVMVKNFSPLLERGEQRGEQHGDGDQHGDGRTLAFHFNWRPVSYTPTSLLLKSTGIDKQEKQIPCDFVVKSIGTRAIGLPGYPFDESKGIVPNVRGFVEKTGQCFRIGLAETRTPR